MSSILYKENSFQTEQRNTKSLSFLQPDAIKSALAFHRSYPKYEPTPLRSLSSLADELGVGTIFVKDESYRLGLNSFKGLGGFYAVAAYVSKKLGINEGDITFERLMEKDVKEKIGNITFASATDGNHGRGVAWAAKTLGFEAVIYMPKGSSPHRLQHIHDTGAKGYITDWNYDDTVRFVAEQAKKEGWVVVQDTAWEGYEDIPKWIMQGYGALAAELMEQMDEVPTHLFLQAGVGSYAASILGYFVSQFQENAPITIIAEPLEADCFYQSISQGKVVNVTGDMQTIMAGLACGEPNPFAWSIIQQYAKGAISCSDDVAAMGMRVYGNPLGDDARIISGESGAVTLGLLYKICKDKRFAMIREKLGLTVDSKILLINTEGDTDPEHYRSIVWEGMYPNDRG